MCAGQEGTIVLPGILMVPLPCSIGPGTQSSRGSHRVTWYLQMHGFANRGIAAAGPAARRVFEGNQFRAIPAPTLTVLVQEDHSFYYRNETDEWVGFNHELIDRMQRHLAVPVEIKSFASQEALSRPLQPARATSCAPRSRSTGRHPTRRS